MGRLYESNGDGVQSEQLLTEINTDTIRQQQLSNFTKNAGINFISNDDAQYKTKFPISFEHLNYLLSGKQPYTTITQVPPEELKARISAYFSSIIAQNENGDFVFNDNPTLFALSLFVGFQAEHIKNIVDRPFNSKSDKLKSSIHKEILSQALGIIGTFYELNYLKGMSAGNWLSKIFPSLWAEKKETTIHLVNPIDQILTVDELDRFLMAGDDDENFDDVIEIDENSSEND